MAAFVESLMIYLLPGFLYYYMCIQYELKDWRKYAALIFGIFGIVNIFKEFISTILEVISLQIH